MSKAIDPQFLDASTQSVQNKDKFLIVETNFKVYAYTSSPIYRELFKRFMTIEYIFPNMIAATITRDKLQKAFQQGGITAKQIIDFLESHSHVNARQNKLAMKQSAMQNVNAHMNAAAKQ